MELNQTQNLLDDKTKTAITRFEEGWTCSQVILCSFNEDFPIDINTAKAISCGFAGGMRCGEICGAISAAIMVIGLWSFHVEANEMKQKSLCFDTVSKFNESFDKRYSSMMCRDILGYDIRDLEERKKFPGQQRRVCPPIIKAIIEILMDCI